MINKIREVLEKQERLFEPGAKYEKFYPLYEAALTIHFSPKTVTRIGAHIRDVLDTKRYMILVVISLIPCTLFGIYNVGYQTQLAGGLSLDFFTVIMQGLKTFLPILLVSYAVGGLWEVLFAIIRKHEINEGFLVSGLLFPLTLPATIPLWQVALGISFGIVIGKEVFGGTGKNFLNPALTARAFLFFSYPMYMSGEIWTMISVSKDKIVDTFSGATPLAVAFLTEKGQSATQSLLDSGFSLSTLFWGGYGASIGETSVVAVLIGAALLIITGVGSWRIMAGCVLGLVGMSTVFNLLAAPAYTPMLGIPPHWHLVIGSFAFGTVFMATDPVSAPSLKASKWTYGILIGVLTVIIRCVNPAYPEGVMLAILLMNVFAPLLDYVFVNRKVAKRIPNVV